MLGRQRWIDFAQDDFNASQVPPEWHSWHTHIRKDPPTEDPIMKASTPPWLAVSLIIAEMYLLISTEEGDMKNKDELIPSAS